MRKIFTLLKNKWKLIIVFVVLLLLNIGIHIVIIFLGAIDYITLFSFIIFLFFCFSIFIKFYKNLLYTVLGLLILQVLMINIEFPECGMNFKYPRYDCKCSGVKKTYIGGKQCVGKITECYQYIGNPNIKDIGFWDLYEKDMFHDTFKVSCENFPNNLSTY